MKEIIYITGGARSGKSSYGQGLAESKSANPIYLATAHIWDEDFNKRVERHKADRGPQWKTIEEEIELSKLSLNGKTVLLDCITLWLTNIFVKNEYDIQNSLKEAKQEWRKLIAKDFTLIVISNELGMSIHPEHESSRKFVDLQGWMNQHIARTATSATLMVSGLPIKLK